MKIALPLHPEFTFYHQNPFTAPRFAIYTIEGERTHVTFKLASIVDNPWCDLNEGQFEEKQLGCSCDDSECTNMRHVFEHYALLDAIGGCSYLLVDRCCENTSRALGNGGVKVYKIPPIIHRIDSAVKNFLIGASLASTFKHIHHAS